jgi:hypothetical protein
MLVQMEYIYLYPCSRSSILSSYNPKLVLSTSSPQPKKISFRLHSSSQSLSYILYIHPPSELSAKWPTVRLSSKEAACKSQMPKPVPRAMPRAILISRASSTRILTSLIKHVHDFCREVELTQDEWVLGVDYINSLGQSYQKNRNETWRLCDILGVES